MSLFSLLMPFVLLRRKINYFLGGIYYCFRSSSAKEAEKKVIAASKWWDVAWYKKTYGRNDLTDQEALDYWCKKGWRDEEDPSKYIRTRNYLNVNSHIYFTNPVIAYMSNGRYSLFCPDNKNNFKSDDDKQRIEAYLAHKKTRKSKSVVYTCISNDYDDINELAAYKFINFDWDYICFTDNTEHITQKQIGIWEIYPFHYNNPKDATRNARWHKTHPHILFPNYDESIWIDGNINILTSFLFDEIKRRNMNFIFPKHFKNVSAYEEYEDVVSLDDPKLIEAEKQFLLSEGMPENLGVVESNILYRRHNEVPLKSIDEEWWNMIEKYSKRDQLALPYILWKHNYSITERSFENSRHRINDFYVFSHKKDRK